ncbi:hypothetical protein [Asanoa siamensis]|uniref:Uncharacterized protein n=1 Tax=Asanoa siamensis TaxID=926357 RepID=A0ABQ4CYR1_9ACTN|nr:hypothetical protein [Asanoa siamensis]GIF76422.1 hypothetical protein Asi02nite_59400 [Asanoa siamensis]
MAKLGVPCAGGPFHGRHFLVDVDDFGLPPEQITELDLVIAQGGNLVDADTSGRYELEAIRARATAPFRYVWVPRNGLGRG